MGKYEMNTADMRRFFNDIHTIAVSTKKIADMLEEKEEKVKRNSHQLPVEPDPDERG
jgi:hypothetical protein